MWHLSLPLMNSFFKTEAVLPDGFPFSQLNFSGHLNQIKLMQAINNWHYYYNNADITLLMKLVSHMLF